MIEQPDVANTAAVVNNSAPLRADKRQFIICTYVQKDIIVEIS